MNINQKVTILTKEADPKRLYYELLAIFDNLGETQKNRLCDGEEEIDSIYQIGESCLPFLTFLGIILNNLNVDQIMMDSLMSKIDFLEYQIFDSEFSDKNKCLCIIKEIKNAFESPEHTFRTFKKAA